jgi:RHS repeat-associated protein
VVDDRALTSSEPSADDKTFAVAAPQITLPKGGGAIRGLGEKFAANPVTGTGSMSVPIATSPGRSGFGPQLALGYDSGSGNGPFGFGWQLSLASITRKTDKGLPRYSEANDSDVFILSGSEDLVPVYRQDRDGTWVAAHRGYRRDADGAWVRDSLGGLIIHEDELDGYLIRRYRPRIEGLFARIERWSKIGVPEDVHWRSISKDNVLTLYGFDAESRIADPLDPSRIFSWLICETRDDRGNAVIYRYKADDGRGLDLDQAHERHRGPRSDVRRTSNRYLKRIHYGNRTPLLDADGNRPSYLEKAHIDAQIADGTWMFEVVFDYGDHDVPAPKPNDDKTTDPAGLLKYSWSPRPDPFSTYRSGFEVRTTRLCQRVLMFHHFPEEAEVGRDCLVRSTDFTYSEEVDPSDVRNPVYSFLLAVTHTGYRRNNGSYDSRCLPPVEFEYTEPVVQGTVEHVDPGSLENLPIGLDGNLYRWADLHGEGIPGILSEQAGEWYYKRNLSPIPQRLPDGREEMRARFASLETITLKPNVGLSAGAELMDLAGDGQPDMVVLHGPTPGLYEHDESEGWQSFRPFTSLLNREVRDPNLRLVDLDGDGHADVLITEDDALVWHASLGEEGFGPATRTAQPLDEEKGPRVVFADGTQSIYLADLSGDGLTDIVRIRNGEVCYWPNLGYCRFGAKVAMDNAPWFDSPDQFDHKRIRLADIDGSGTTDILYLHREGAHLYFNQSGNGWSRSTRLSAFPRIDDHLSITPVDLLGNGTACLVWSSPLPGDARRPMRYVNLMGEEKPHLLVKVKNNLGTTTDIHYAPSTKFYLQDKRAGKPWLTRLPFPVHVVERVSVTDKWRGSTFSTTYSYHHGHFDGLEREFRGFGRVEQIDTEDYGKFLAGSLGSPYITPDHELYQPPVKTVTWFHTGATATQGRLLSAYASEFFPHWFHALHPQTTDTLGGFEEKTLPDPDFENLDLTADEWREALRACKGTTLRQEIYELDVDALREGTHRPVRLFSTAYHNCHIDRLQPRGTNHHAVFFATESEAITYHYELDLRTPPVTPDPRVSHTINLRIDAFGHVLQSVAIAYPRFLPFDDTDRALNTETASLIKTVQDETHIAYTETRYTDDLKASLANAGHHRLPLPCEVQTYELTGITSKSDDHPLTADPQDARYYSIERLRAYRLSEHYQASGKTVGTIQYQDQPDTHSNPVPAQKRLVEHVRTLYFDDASGTAAPTQPLAFGQHGPRGLKYQDYKLALTDNLLTAVFGNRLADPIAGSSARQKLTSTTTTGYLSGTDLAHQFAPLDTSGQYWMRSGIVGFAADAAQNFFLPERYEDSFGHTTNVTFDSRNLFIESTTDARSNEVRIIDFDFVVLTPRAMQDANGNVTRAVFDVLGVPVAVALESGGDTVGNLSGPGLLDPPPSEVTHFLDLTPYDETVPRRWLDEATSRFLYHFGELVDATGTIIGWEGRPAAACAIQRETHIADLGGRATKLQVAIEYSDGGGNVLIKKAQAEPDPDSTEPTPPLRWIASGKTILNNKGKPVKHYEPYFSAAGHRYEESQEEGVTPLIYYDAIGRVIRIEFPDGSFSRVEFTPWVVRTFDQNDTVLESRWYTDRHPPDYKLPLPIHPITRESLVSADQRAAWLTAHHADTPAEAHLDSLGREVIAIAHNRVEDANGTVSYGGKLYRDERHVTFTKLDAEGKPLWIRDARANLVIQYITPPKTNDDAGEGVPYRTDMATGQRTYSVPCYDIAGNLLFQHTPDAGDRRMLVDAGGKPMLAWDANDTGPPSSAQTRTFYTEYDELHRPIRHWLKGDAGATALVEAFDYCDTVHPLLADGAIDLAEARQRRLIGHAVRHWDPSSLATVDRIDLSGQPAHLTRTLIKPDADDAVGVLNWDTANRSTLLEAETFHQITEHDALGRLTRLYNWHRDITFAAQGDQHTPGATNRVAVHEPAYNERGALTSEWLHIRASKTTNPNGRVSFSPDPQRSRQAIQQITYDAKGQKLSLVLGNGTTTRYTYDPETFRLVHLYTRRTGPISRGDCSSNTADAQRPRRPCGMQNLHYTFDPTGNITHIQDDAQDSRYFANSFVEPSSDYTYDALYRLIEATGRENAAALAEPRSREAPWPTNGFPSPDALRNYRQRYRYDAVGNLAEMVHIPSSGTGWTRHYTTHAEGNQLNQTWYGSTTLTAITYRYDLHGNMLNLNRVETPPPLDPDDDWGRYVKWDWRDMILGLDLGGGGLARYHYGIDKHRTRKHITRTGVTEDRIYLAGFELYRRFKAGSTTPVEEIESHHLSQGDQRVLLVDDVIRAGGIADPRPDHLSVKTQTLFRYQYSNHIGSACLELDHAAAIISYEEYHPYGTSAYRMMASAVQAPPRRYRYKGTERDEESGLSYHQARYYSPILGRWLSFDSATNVPAVNRYLAFHASPVVHTDPGGNEPPLIMSGMSTPMPPMCPAPPMLNPAAGNSAVALGPQLSSGGGALAKGMQLPAPPALAAGEAAAEESAAAEQSTAATSAGAGSVMEGLGLGAILPNMATLAVISTQRYMARTAAIVKSGTVYGVPTKDFWPDLGPDEFPRLKLELKPTTTTTTKPELQKQTEEEKDKSPVVRGRIYVTYVAKNPKTGALYAGRTDMPFEAKAGDLSDKLFLIALAKKAISLRYAKDKEGKVDAAGWEGAQIDTIGLGKAFNRKERYKDEAYHAMRGREQMLADAIGGTRTDIGSLLSDVKKDELEVAPGVFINLSGNDIRPVAKDHPCGPYFHYAAVRAFNEELWVYTGTVKDIVRCNAPPRTR